MWKHEGIKGFFKGNGTNIIRVAPFSAFEFFFYEFYKNFFFAHRSSHDYMPKLICGGLTGMTASTLVIFKAGIYDLLNTLSDLSFGFDQNSAHNSGERGH